MSLEENHLEAQTAAAYGDWIASNEISVLNSHLNAQNEGYQEALHELNKLRQIIGTPEHILGNPKTKHGEIAEFLEVFSRRANRHVNLKNPEATFEGVKRNGLTDYMIGKTPYQSKFINGENNTLSYTLDHLNDYITDNPNLKYHIAKDHYNTIEKINNGQTEGLNLHSRSINAIKRKIEGIEKATGRSFEDVVEPSQAKYSEVQQGKIHDTVEQRENSITETNKKRIESIENKHGVSFQGFVGAAGVGFTIGYTTSLGKQVIQERSLHILKSKEVHKNALVGGGIGAVTSGGGYLLMHGLNIPGPIVAGVVTTTQGIAYNVNSYRKGNLNKSELGKNIAICTGEGGLIAAGAYVGQAFIPIPVVGTIVGTIATQYTIGATKQIFIINPRVNDSILKNLHDYKENLQKNRKRQVKREKKISEYSQKWSKKSVSKNYTNEHRLKASVKAHDTTRGINKEPIKNTIELDEFMSKTILAA